MLNYVHVLAALTIDAMVIASPLVVPRRVLGTLLLIKTNTELNMKHCKKSKSTLTAIMHTHTTVPD